MPNVARSYPMLLAMLAAQLLAACALPLRHSEVDHDGSELVATDEPLHPAPDSFVSSTSSEPSRSSDVALAAARLVANNGQLGHPAWPQEFAPLWTSCARGAFSPVRDPLSERGVYRAADPLGLSNTWLGVGLAFGGNSVSPWIFASPCGTVWLNEIPVARVAGLAPDVAGRDTSLLFTTARPRHPGASVPGFTAPMVDDRVNRGDHQEGPRTAKPRPDEQPTTGQDRAAVDVGRRTAEPPASGSAPEATRRWPRGLD